MKKNGIISLIGILILLLVALAGCARPAPEQSTQIVTNVTEAPMQAVFSPVISAAPAETTPTASMLTAEEVKEIALNHAAFTADQVTRLRAEFDWDDGVPVYDVEFREGYWEYDYEIHAETGKIISYNRDD